MRHIRLYEDYSDNEIRSLLADMKSLDLALTDDEKDMLEFVIQFGAGKSPEDYAEYLYDYYENPEEYGIDRDGDYYDMIWYLYENSVEDHARSILGGPMRMSSGKTWDETAISNEPLYKLYLKMGDYAAKLKR